MLLITYMQEGRQPAHLIKIHDMSMVYGRYLCIAEKAEIPFRDGSMAIQAGKCVACTHAIISNL